MAVSGHQWPSDACRTFSRAAFIFQLPAGVNESFVSLSERSTSGPCGSVQPTYKKKGAAPGGNELAIEGSYQQEQGRRALGHELGIEGSGQEEERRRNWVDALGI